MRNLQTTKDSLGSDNRVSTIQGSLALYGLPGFAGSTPPRLLNAASLRRAELSSCQTSRPTLCYRVLLCAEQGLVLQVVLDNKVACKEAWGVCRVEE